MVRPDYIFETGTLRLDTRTRLLFRANAPVTLAPKSYELLRILIENEGRAIAKREFLDALWPDVEVEEGNLPFQISTLRKALGPQAGAWIETVPRHGYRWSAPVAYRSEPATQAAGTSRGAVEEHADTVSGASWLPAARTPLIGREKELAAVKRLLLGPDARLVTLTGAGGAGKTRVALQVAADVAEHFRGGVYFVPLASVARAEMVAPVLAEALQLRYTGGKPLIEALREHLRLAIYAPVLLLADNFEHLSPAAALLADILESCALAKVLVTSRATLHIYGEYEYPITGLTVPEPGLFVPLEELSQYAAVRLFVQRASAVSAGFELKQENADAVVGLCGRLDGLPLAIELAAARTRILSPAAILAKLDNRLDILIGGALDVPPRQRSLRNTIDWSYRLLNPAERRLFRRLSVFAGGCTLESVEAVCNTRRDLELDVPNGMSSLVDNSLLQRSYDHADEPRFAMLQTLREYALERLAESADYDLARRAHAAYCLVLAEEGNVAASVAQDNEWLDRCSIEHANLRAAIDWLIDGEHAEWAMRMSIALFPFWERRDHFAEGLERLKSILNLSRHEDRIPERAMVASCAGALAANLGDWEESLSLLGESLRNYRDAGDTRGIAAQLNRMGATRLLEGKYSEAALLLERSVLAWRDAGDLSIAAGVLCALADVVSLAGDHTRASALLGEALSTFQTFGDNLGAARALSYLGDAARNRGDAEASHRHYSDSLNAFRAIGDRAGVARSCADLGRLTTDTGDLAAAASHFRESLEIVVELGHRRGIERILDGFVHLAARRGNFEEALKVAGAANSIRRSLGASRRPSEQAVLDKTLELAGKHLESGSAGAAWRAGSRMSLREAADYVGNLVGISPI